MTESHIYSQIPRPDASLIEALRGIPVADLHDELNAVDRKIRLLAPTLRPIIEGVRIVGPAVTAFNSPGDNLMMHTALYYAERRRTRPIQWWRSEWGTLGRERIDTGEAGGRRRRFGGWSGT